MKKFPWLFASLAAGSVFLSGCYTQLYTNAYVDRARDYRRQEAEDSALAKARLEGDTLAPSDSGHQGEGADRKTVIVNNYYEEAPAYAYRGYSTWDWDYPVFSFGLYSSRYQSYSDPYWWHDPYYRGYGRHHGRRHDYGSYSSGGGGGPREDHRIFSPEPGYPELRKGRRSHVDPAPAPASAPKVSSESERSHQDDPAPRESSSSDNQKKESGSGGESHPSLQKGKRR